MFGGSFTKLRSYSINRSTWILQVVVVEDGETLSNIPAVSGLLAYQKDNHTLHVRMKDSWETVAVEKKVYKLRV
jgi:hypothetical protein